MRNIFQFVYDLRDAQPSQYEEIADVIHSLDEEALRIQRSFWLIADTVDCAREVSNWLLGQMPDHLQFRETYVSKIPSLPFEELKRNYLHWSSDDAKTERSIEHWIRRALHFPNLE